MKRCVVLALLPALLILTTTGLAVKDAPKYKTVEAKRFTVADGIQLDSRVDPQQYVAETNQGLQKQLVRANIAEQVVGEGATVSDSDAANSIVIESRLIDFPPEVHGSFKERVMTVEVKIYRRSDRRLLVSSKRDYKVIIQFYTNLQRFSNTTAALVVDEVQKQIKILPPLDSLPPVPPEETKPPATPPQAASGETITNSLILEMVTAKIPEEVIIAKILVSPNNFDLSTSGLADLTQKGLSPAIMKAMIAAPKGGPTPAAVAAPAANAAPILPPVPHHQGPYSVMEVKRLKVAPGVAFPPKGGDPQPYLDAFYERFLKEIERRSLALHAIPEGASAPEPAGADAVTIEGVITNFRADRVGNFLVHTEVGNLTVQFIFYRRSDHLPTGRMTVEVRGCTYLSWYETPERFAKHLPYYVVGGMKYQLK
jgi:hypothetical protein